MKLSGLSARRFRRIVNSIRLYDKKEATTHKWNKKADENYDEHHKVNEIRIMYRA